MIDTKTAHRGAVADPDPLAAGSGWRGLVGARFVDTTDDPREALHWITDQRISCLHRPGRVGQRAGMARPP
ncbi:hypothetical protein [Pseudonocardia yuanmonensis]